MNGTLLRGCVATAAMRAVLSHVCLMVVGMSLLACDARGPAVRIPENDSVTVSTDAVNYMHDWGLGYTLFNQADNQAIGGGILGFLEGPGGKGCCLKLPKKWQPGMQVRVEWQKSDRKMTEETMRIKVLEIPGYDKPGDLYVVFYPGDEVEAVVSWAEPGHPEWRGRERELPYQACISKLSKKACEKELPKYPPISHERMVSSIRKSCQPERLRHSPDPIGYLRRCEAWVQECKLQGNVDRKKCELDYVEE